MAVGASDADRNSQLSVSELKRLLEARGLDYRDCLEKRDLLDRLAQDVQRRGDRVGDIGGSTSKSSKSRLTESERSLVELFERCAPSVAFIQTSAQEQSMELTLNEAEEMPTGTGSGFVWDDAGHIVTNFHVIKDALETRGRARVTLKRGAEGYNARLVGADPEKDLAVLQVDAPKESLRPIALGSSSDLVVGQSVVAIGNPFGLDNTLTTGVVSALGREIMGIGGRPITGLIQTSAAINPGNSGGPLLDSAGRLIGVNTMIVSPVGVFAGIGFAIPVDMVRRIVNQLIRFGRVRHPTLGVNVAPDQMLRSLAQSRNQNWEGVLVISVAEGSPAEHAGIHATRRDRSGLVLGDIIASVAGVKTRQVEDLLSAVEERQIGEVVDVVVLRGAGARDQPEVLTLKVQLAERDASLLAPGAPARRPTTRSPLSRRRSRL